MIIIVEPQCIGFEHSEINTALLAVVKHAFPLEKMLFFAEMSHLNLVKEKSRIHGINDIGYHSIICPTRGFSDARRFFLELKLMKQVNQMVISHAAGRLIFASITSAGLWCIKMFFRKWRNIQVTVIPHSVLETIFTLPSYKPWVMLFWFRLNLCFGNRTNLHYLLYGHLKEKELIKVLPKIAPYVHSIDLPYFFSAPEVISFTENKKVRFGSFGGWHLKKGTDLFCKLAADVHNSSEKTNSEFILIGNIGDLSIRKKIGNEVILPSIEKPLTRSDFELYAETIDYAVFCFRPQSFRLTVSGTFYDALSFVKPIIAIKTPFFEDYFNTLGDIGYLCENYEEMKELIINLIAHRHYERYKNQCENILKGRDLLDIPHITKQMQGILSKEIV